MRCSYLAQLTIGRSSGKGSFGEERQLYATYHLVSIPPSPDTVHKAYPSSKRVGGELHEKRKKLKMAIGSVTNGYGEDASWA